MPPHAEAFLAVKRARADLDLALERLETLNADDRQRVSYSVHALNNYLMVVSMTLGLLRAKLGPKDDREIKKWLDSLKQATNLMMSTARGVLTVASEALPPLLLEQVSLAEIADGVCGAYGDIARKKRVRIVWRRPSLENRVLTDRVAAGAVLDNLLSNAVKYSQPGTTVTVAATVQLEEALCSVTDQGPGLSEDDQSKLFQRGVSLSSKPTAGESSTGFGLAIANDLTKALGGRLSCTSVLGHGSSFVFSLPLSHRPDDPARTNFRRRSTDLVS